MGLRGITPKVEVLGCLVCHVKPANVRGLCWEHYSKALTSIKMKTTTWDELIELGKALPSKARSKKVKE